MQSIIYLGVDTCYIIFITNHFKGTGEDELKETLALKKYSLPI